eukprot:11368570-Heterocapsa_arctica.AAC.1
MPVLEDVENSLETRPDQSFMTMRTDCGALTCNIMLTNLSLNISNIELWTDPSGELLNKSLVGAKSTKSRLRSTVTV